MLACRHRDGGSPTILRPLTCVPRDGATLTMLSPLACVPRDGATLTMLSPLACVPRDGDSPTMLRPLACVPRDGGHPMPDSHPEITIRRSLVEAHSFVTPGQGAERPQPGDSSEQGKSASERLTSIYDAHNHRGPHDCPHHASIVVAAPCAGQQARTSE